MVEGLDNVTICWSFHDHDFTEHNQKALYVIMLTIPSNVLSAFMALFFFLVLKRTHINGDYGSTLQKPY